MKLPLAFSVSAPCATPVTCTADIVPPPLVASLPSTPGAFTVSVVLNPVE
ncbi:MAG: hypothetical protein U0P30_03970 [Vicinamibacterales bacterium]